MQKLARLFVASIGVALMASVVMAASKPPKQGPREINSTMGIAGSASSARHCLGSSGANTHSLGNVPSGTRFTITFVSDFDPVAGVTVMQMGADAPDGRARATYAYDDDSGGNLEPELRFQTGHSGTAVLHVSKYSSSSSAGCYFYKVEVQTP